MSNKIVLNLIRELSAKPEESRYNDQDLGKVLTREILIEVITKENDSDAVRTAMGILAELYPGSETVDFLATRHPSGQTTNVDIEVATSGHGDPTVDNLARRYPDDPDAHLK